MTRSALVICVVLGVALLCASPPATAVPVVRPDGTELKLGTRPFHVYGFNYEFNNVHPKLDYFEAPTRAGRLRVRADFAEAARLGANTMRIYVELHEIMATATRTRPRGLRTLQHLLEEAERAGLLLDITGNLVWHIDHSPRWYEHVSEHGRWRVQERFWRAVARSAPGHRTSSATSSPASRRSPIPTAGTRDFSSTTSSAAALHVTRERASTSTYGCGAGASRAWWCCGGSHDRLLIGVHVTAICTTTTPTCSCRPH